MLSKIPEFVVGHPRAEGTVLGPLVSKNQRDRVRSFIESGISDGARLLAGGPDAPPSFECGYYVRPTILSDVFPDMAVAREEIFGPVLSVMPVDSEDEAVEIANGTSYGLFGAVWSNDIERALRIAGRLRCGGVTINGARGGGLGTPFGGFRQSGIGREGGRFGLLEFCEPKTIFNDPSPGSLARPSQIASQPGRDRP